MFSWIQENSNLLYEVYFFTSYILSMIMNFVILYMKSKNNSLQLTTQYRGPGDDFILFMLWLFSPITLPIRFFYFSANLLELYHGRNNF